VVTLRKDDPVTHRTLANSLEQARLKSANLRIDPGLVPGLLRIDSARSC